MNMFLNVIFVADDARKILWRRKLTFFTFDFIACSKNVNKMQSRLYNKIIKQLYNKIFYNIFNAAVLCQRKAERQSKKVIDQRVHAERNIEQKQRFCSTRLAAIAFKKKRKMFPFYTKRISLPRQFQHHAKIHRRQRFNLCYVILRGSLDGIRRIYFSHKDILD